MLITSMEAYTASRTDGYRQTYVVCMQFSSNFAARGFGRCHDAKVCRRIVSTVMTLGLLHLKRLIMALRQRRQRLS